MSAVKKKFTTEDAGPRGQMKMGSVPSGGDLDAARRRNTAYEYLCHLEEARQWIQACLKIELPPASELEAALRNGIIVAKLAIFFAPDAVKTKNIYDIEETVYKSKGLVFRHTDNITQWLKGMRSVKFPEIFYPEVTDIYDKKNMPRVIYCIHALSRYLYHLGIAPEIEDLHGVAQFTEEEINAIDKELQKSGVQMPKFGKIGGILAKELGEDDAAMHAAILKINQLLEKKAEVPELLESMKVPAAGIKKLEGESAGEYRARLIEAREAKVASAGPAAQTQERDVYDTNLTKAEIQKEVNVVNAAVQQKIKDAAYVEINNAVDKGDKGLLLEKLKLPAAELNEVDDGAAAHYLSSLTKAKAAAGAPLSPKQVQDGVDSGNAAFQQQKRIAEAVKGLVAAAKAGDAEKFIEQLSKGSQWFGDCTPSAAKRYMEGVAKLNENASAEDVKRVVEAVNAELDHEAVVKAAVKRVNEAIDGGNAETTLSALKQSALGLQDVDDAGAFMYQEMLKAAKDSAKRDLEILDLQKVVNSANQLAEENAKRAAALFALHEAVRSGDAGKTLTALKDPFVGVTPVHDTCKDRYQDSLSIAVKNKERAAGHTTSRWKKFATDDGRTYYFNKETKETVWIPPADMLDPQMSVPEVQEVVDRCNADQARWDSLVKAEPNIVTLQAHIRGMLVRRKLNERLKLFAANEKAVVLLQAQTRGLLQRQKYQARKNYLASQVKAVVRLQAAWKGVKARRQYDNLTKVTNPPVVTVRKFLHLLDQSDLDFAEELRVQNLKEKVVTEIKSNKQLEEDLNEMDIKIGLLVRNRIELQDVVKQSKKLKQAGRQNEGGSSLSLNTPASILASQGLKSLNKEARERLGSYQHLFYLLQTNPNYLARLVFIDQLLERWTLVKAQKFMNHLIDTVYNFGSNTREKYLLLKLYRAAMHQEVLVKVDQTRDFIVGNPAVIRLVVLHHRDRDPYLKETLGPVITKVVNADEDLNPDPVDIYKRWIGQQESQTGEKSALPYEVPREEALQHEHVRTTFDKISHRLLEVAGEFLDAIIKALPKLPYGLRYICMCLREDLKKKFPTVEDDEVLKVLGNILYYRFINPIITTPELVDVFPPNISNQLANNARRNLACIARTLQLSASGQLYDNDMTKPDNQFLASAWEKFKKYFDQAAKVESLEDHFHIDEYSDVVLLTKSTVYVSPEAIFHTHEIIAHNVDAIAPDESDPLRVILKDLGPVGDETVVLGEEGSQQLANSKTEISLTLTNKFEVPENDNTNLRTLFVRTKKMVIDVIRFQEGRNLLEILETPANAEMEKQYSEWLQTRRTAPAGGDAATEEMKRSATVSKQDMPSTLKELKEKILSNCAILEKEKMCTKADNYQAILNSVAQDIRNQRIYRQQRKQELHKLTTTLEELHKKRQFFSDQVNYYDQYVNSCMTQMSKGKSKKKAFSFLRGSKVKEDGWVPGRSVKYTALKLKEKGVLISADVNETQLKLVTIEIIAQDDPGGFDVNATSMGIKLEKMDLQLQDLLQMQYENIPTMKMFDMCVVSVNLMIFLINKKFYGK